MIHMMILTPEELVRVQSRNLETACQTLRPPARHRRLPLAVALALTAWLGCGDDGATPIPDAGTEIPGGDASSASPDAGVLPDASPDMGTDATPDDFGSYADLVVDAPGAGDIPFRDPELAINGVRGSGVSQGGLDVFSLGVTATPASAQDNYITLAWSGRTVIDGPGTDFVVFENALAIEPGVRHFIEAAVIELSRDGQSWVAMPYDYLNADETVYSDDPGLWSGFAGVQPVLLHEEDNPVDAFDPALAGGDHFDLAALPDDGGEAAAIKREGFAFLRVTSAASIVNADTGELFPRDIVAGGADVDGVYARYFTTTALHHQESTPR